MRIRARNRRRLLRHYLPLGLLTAVATVVLAALADVPSSVGHQLTVASGLIAVALFGASLAIGPWHLLVTGRRAAVSTDLRRDVGILAGIMSVLHVVVALVGWVDPLMYFVYPVLTFLRQAPPRQDEVALANYMGLASAILVGLLLATSGDWALRRYGAVRWKRLQQLAYWGFALAIGHAILWQRFEQRTQSLVVLFGVTYLATAALQLGGYARRAI